MGHYKKANGDNYIGMFVNGLYEGKGQLTHSDSSIYNGNFKGGLKNGEGLLMNANGDKFEGFCRNDVYIGNIVNTNKASSHD